MTVKNAINTVSKQGRLIVVDIRGAQTGPSIAKLKADITEISRRSASGKLNVLVNLDGVTAADDDSAEEAKKFFVNLPFKRMAIYGGSALVSMSTKILIRFLVNPDQVKIFRTETQAREWLESVGSVKGKLKVGVNKIKKYADKVTAP
jgi:hypothetical protein